MEQRKVCYKHNHTVSFCSTLGNSQYSQQQAGYQQGAAQQQTYSQQQYPNQQSYPGQQQGYGKAATGQVFAVLNLDASIPHLNYAKLFYWLTLAMHIL